MDKDKIEKINSQHLETIVAAAAMAGWVGCKVGKSMDQCVNEVVGAARKGEEIAKIVNALPEPGVTDAN